MNTIHFFHFNYTMRKTKFKYQAKQLRTKANFREHKRELQWTRGREAHDGGLAITQVQPTADTEKVWPIVTNSSHF